jgi:hypothetical protein
MVTRYIQSPNLKDYQDAIDGLKEGDFVCVAGQSLIQYKSHEVRYDRLSNRAQGIDIKGKIASFSELHSDGNIRVEQSGIVVQPDCTLTIGPFEELKELFVNGFKAHMNLRAIQELRKLEDAFE